MTHIARLRYVDVDMTEPHFAGNPEPETQLAPEITLELGERIVSVNGHYREDRMSYLTVVARVWITSP